MTASMLDRPLAKIHRQLHVLVEVGHIYRVDMSFIKQYRIYLCLMSALGLAPYLGFYSPTPRIRLFIPLILYTLFLIVIMPMLSTSFLSQLYDQFQRNNISVRNIVQFAHFSILSIMYTLVLLSSTFLSTSHAEFLNSFETFHRGVCNLNIKHRNHSIIVKLIYEAVMCNLIWSIALFHIHLEGGRVVDAIVNSGLVFVVMVFMYHVRSMASLMGHDLQIIRCHLFKPNRSGFDGPSLVLLEEFLCVKQSFESVFGQTLALCAILDFVKFVFVVYIFIMLLFVIGFTWSTIIKGTLGYVVPLVVKNVMLAKACQQIADEVGIFIL